MAIYVRFLAFFSSPPAKSLPAVAGGEGVEDDRGGCSLVSQPKD